MSKAEEARSEQLPPGAEGGSASLVNALVILALLPAMVSAIVVLFSGAGDSERYLVDLARFLPELPDYWDDGGLVHDSLRADLEGCDPISIFDPDLQLVVRQAYESNPWVRRVTAVRRVFPARIAVEIEIREPYAAVERDGEYLLVDADAVFLPVWSDTPIVAPPLITLRDEGRRPFDEHGYDAAWFRDAVCEGVAVIADLETLADSSAFDVLSIEMVDVSNFRGRLRPREAEVVLVTGQQGPGAGGGPSSRPVVIEWGRSRRHERAAIELPIERKIAHLEEVVRTRPGLAGIQRIDVRFDSAYVRGPSVPRDG